MKYLLCVTTDSTELTLTYDTAANTLEGAGAPPANTLIPSADKKQEQMLINLVMGSACNYRCSYCCQSGIREKAYAPLAPDRLADGIRAYQDRYFPHADSIKILYWGGEPLMYMDMMRPLAEELREIHQHVSMGICTNGALLDKAKLTWLHDNQIGVGFSYDGPGQYVRHNSDVLAPGSFALEALKDGIAHHGWSVNPVWHKGNPLPSRYISFMNERLGTEDYTIGDSQALMVSDTSSLSWALSEAELYAFCVDTCRGLYEGTAHQIAHVYFKAATGFLQSLGSIGGFGGCLNSLTEKRRSLNVDISGNIWGCHSCAGVMQDDLGGNWHLGTLYDEPSVPDYRVLTRRRKERCEDCLLRMFCGGGCAVTPAKYDDINCRIQWHKYFPALSMAVNLMTGGQLTRVERMEE